ncbi:MAG TPA: class I SAM-dependent methyltransferase [Gammaproteobacteria bacterium]|nr:class I SAM-dependent methyltransferase [Gammaproteobacteria bacterium]
MLRLSYTLLAPIYDSIVASPTKHPRKKNLQHLTAYTGRHVLINGIGSGLDIPYLPAGPIYTGNDLTPAMLQRAKKISARHNIPIDLHHADVMQLPYADACFDAVVLHLILAVVPQPLKALQESSRVLKPGGRIFIFDKFLQQNELALLRRAINPFIRHIATRTDVVFEPLLLQCPELQLINNEAALFGGWFRFIQLQKRAP